MKRLLGLIGICVLGGLLLFAMVTWMDSQAVHALTPPPGCETIDTDISSPTEMWSLARAPCYRITTSTVAIQAGAWLTIEAGVEVYFDAGARLQISQNAGLTAIGTDLAPILFTSAITTGEETRCDWNGIIINSEFGPPVHIQHAIIEYACVGVDPGGRRDLSITHNEFRYNGDTLGGAIVGDADDSSISYNTIHSCQNGIVFNEAGDNELRNNLIYTIDHDGIAFVGGGVGGGARNLIISNIIHHCSDHGIRIEDGADNNVFSNTLYLNPGGAIYLLDQVGTSVQYNHIYNNGGGGGYQASLYVAGTSLINTIAHNVIYDTEAEAIEFGIGTGMWPGSLMEINALCSLPSYELQNDDGTINAPHNWWGTNTPTPGVNYTGPVNTDPPIILSLNGNANGVVTVQLRDSAGNTVPPPPTQPTTPPAPNARAIELSTNWGTFALNTVEVDDSGEATTTWNPGVPPAPDTIVITATGFCNYSVITTLSLPDLIITKTTAMVEVEHGGLLNYTIDYCNIGDATAENVEITDTLPPWTTYVSNNSGLPCVGCTPGGSGPLVWDANTLPVGACGSFTLVAQVNSNAPCGTPLNNTVNIATTMLELDDTNNQDQAGPVTVTGADVTVTKTTAMLEVPVEGLLNYTIAYNNLGSSAAQNVEITDNLPAGTTYAGDNSGLPCTGCVIGGSGPLVWNAGTLPSGAGSSFTLILRVDSTLPCGATLTGNTVSIATTTPECDTANNNDQTGPVQVVGADVTIAKTTAALEALRGGLLDYTITYNNLGGADAQNVEITDILPAGTTYVSNNSGLPCGGCTLGGAGPLVWDVGALPSGAGSSFTLTLQVHNSIPCSATLFGNTIAITTTTSECDNTNNSAQVAPLHVVGADVTIAKTTAMLEVERGGLLNYTITYNNIGGAAAQNVEITDVLPAGTTYVSDNSGLACVGCVAGGGGPLVWNAGTLPSGAGSSFTLVLRVNNTVPCSTTLAGNAVTIATTTTPECDDTNNDAQTAPVHVIGADVTVAKTTAMLEVLRGGLLNYTITYNNVGGAAAQNVEITDVLPAGTTYVSDNSGLACTGCTPGGSGPLVWNAGTLPSGAGGSFTLVLRVNNTVPCSTTLAGNAVSIATTTPECDDTNNDDQTGSVHVIGADMTVAKTTAMLEVLRGGLLNYTITYNNVGDAAAQNVEITDVLPAGTTYVSDDSGLACVGCVVGGAGPLVWDAGALPSGAGSSFTLVLRVNNTVPCSTTLAGNAVSIATTTPECDDTNNDDQANPVHVIGADVTIIKTTPITQAGHGDLLNFTITYRNIGDAPAENVEITDILPAGTTYVSDNSGLPCVGCTPGGSGPLVWDANTLPSGTSGSFTLVLRVESGTPCSTTLPSNIVSIATTTPECDTTNNNDQAGSIHIVCPDLVVVKDTDVGLPTSMSLTAEKQAALNRLLQQSQEYGPLAVSQTHDFVLEGDLLTYTISIVNTGDYPAYNVVLSETLPLYTQYVGYGWTNSGGRTYTLTVGTLPPGDGRIYYFVVRIDDLIPLAVSDLYNRVCGWSDNEDLYPDDNCNPELTPVRHPRLTITKTANTTFSKAGHDVTYTILVCNTGDVALNKLAVVDTLIPGVNATFGPSLAPGVCESHNFARTIQPGDPDPLINTAVARYLVDGRPDRALVATDNYTVNLFYPSITFDKTGDLLSKIGDAVDYTLTLNNTSSADTPNLVCTITDAMLGINETVTLASGDSHVLNATYTVPAGASDPLVNTAQVSCSPVGFSNIYEASASHSVNLFQPSIVLDKTGDALSKGGDPVNYTLTLNNTSSADSPNLVCLITDAMLGINETVTLASGASRVIHAAYTIPAGSPDPLVNTAQVTCSPIGFPNVLTANDNHVVNLFQPAVQVEKTGPASGYVDSVITYTFRIINTGSADGPALILDSVIDVGDGWSGLGNLTSIARANGCDPLPPGSSCSFDVPYTIRPSDPNPLTNTVTVNFHPDGFPNIITHSDSHTVTTSIDVDLVVTKNDDVGPTTPTSTRLPADKQAAVDRLLRETAKSAALAPAQLPHREFVGPGDLITFTIVVINTGHSIARDVVVTETLPLYTTYVGYGWQQVGTTRNYTMSLPNLPPQVGRVITFVVRIDDPLPSEVRSIINYVCSFSSVPDTDDTDNCRYTDAPVINLGLDKEADPSSILAGEQVTFTITLSNSSQVIGSSTEGITITDNLPDGFTWITDTAETVGLTRVLTSPVLIWHTPSFTIGEHISFTLTARADPAIECGDWVTNVVTATVRVGAQEYSWIATAGVRIQCYIDLLVTKDDNVGPITPMNVSLTPEKQAIVERVQREARASAPMAAVQQHREFVEPGDLITYTITIANVGAYTITNAVLSETIPLYTSYVGYGWTHLGGRTYITTVGTLPPGVGHVYFIVVRVDDPVPSGVHNLINYVCGWGDEPDEYPGNNCNYEDTPVHTEGKLYVANRNSGTLDVFNTTDFGYVTTIPVDVNPWGMATFGSYLYVGDFHEQDGQARLYIIDTDTNTVLGSRAVGSPVHSAHLAHMTVLTSTDVVSLYVTSHSGPPAIAVINAEPPWNILDEIALNRPDTWEFGFYGATTDTNRRCVYFTKRDFGGVGIWRLCPPSDAPEYVYPTDEGANEKPFSILYNPNDDLVYVAFALLNEVWIFDPDGFLLLDRVPTEVQDPTVHTGHGGQGLVASGQYVFVSNYISESVTVITNGSAARQAKASLAALQVEFDHRIYLPMTLRNFSAQSAPPDPPIQPTQINTVTIHLSGRPKGMAATPHLLFVTLPHEDRVAIIDTATLTVTQEISTVGDHPHSVIMVEGN